jgi:hypothetical protein
MSAPVSENDLSYSVSLIFDLAHGMQATMTFDSRIATGI